MSHRCSVCRSLQRLLFNRSSAYLDGAALSGTLALPTVEITSATTPSPTQSLTIDNSRLSPAAAEPNISVAIAAGGSHNGKETSIGDRNPTTQVASPREFDEIDEFGYPIQSPEKLLSGRYPAHQSVRLLVIERSGRRSLGVSLAGNRDPSKMSVFVCGVRPDGAAAADGRLRIGDELLEVNGQVLLGKSHLNAAPIIAGCRTPSVKLVIARQPEALGSMAVKPLEPPFSLPVDPKACSQTSVGSNGSLQSSRLAVSDSPAAVVKPEEPPKADTIVGPYGVEIACTLMKGKQGLGFAIMEGNALDEPGIYVKQVTEKGPAAEEGSIRTGDRLLRANEFDLSHALYDEALDKLRSMAGEVRILVARRQVTPPPPPEAAPPQPQPQPPQPQPPPPQQQQQQQQQPAAASASSATTTIVKPKKEVRIALPSTTDSTTNANATGENSSASSVVDGQRQPGEDSATLQNSSARPVVERAEEAPVPQQATNHARESAAATASAAGNMVKDKEKKEPSGGGDVGGSGSLATCEIQPGRETVIEIDKGDNTLGLSIVGGNDTTLNAIVIHEVYDTGAAWKDRRLWAGDQILAVDERDLSNVSHEDAKNILLQAGPRVRLRVWRDDKEITENDLYELIRVDLVRKPGMGLGFSIVGRSKDEGVLISDIIKGGVAESDRRLQPGDRILEINGKNVRKTPHAEVATSLKSSQGKVSFLIGRLKHVGVVKSKKKTGGF